MQQNHFIDFVNASIVSIHRLTAVLKDCLIYLKTMTQHALCPPPPRNENPVYIHTETDKQVEQLKVGQKPVERLSITSASFPKFWTPVSAL